MTKITREEILKLAKLARLRLSNEEVDKFTNEIGNILSYAETLENVATDDLKPTYQVTGLSNVVREDKVIDYGPDQKDLLSNLPSRDKNLIKVKRMIG